MENFRLYLKYIRMTIHSQMAYKTSFCLMTVGNFFVQIIEFVGVYALFQRFGSINSWTVFEVALFYGIIHMAFAIAECVGRGYDIFYIHVREGTFDRLLLRPRTLPLQILGEQFQLMRVGRFLQGALVMTIGLMNLGHPLGWTDYVLMFLSVIGGVFTFVGLFVLSATLSFFTIDSLEVINAFTYGGVQAAQYPIDVYKKWFQRFVMYVIPVGAVGYLPLNAVLRNGPLLPAFLVPVFGMMFFFVTLQIFRIGTYYYCSTGS